MIRYRSLSAILRLATLLVTFILAGMGSAQVPTGGGQGFVDRRKTRMEPPALYFDMRHLKLNLNINPEVRRLSGTAEITVTGIHSSLSRVNLNAADMTISQVTQTLPGMSPPLSFEHRADTLKIDLPKPLMRGESISLTITYAVEPRLGLYFVGPDSAHPGKPLQVWSQGQSEENRYWFPSVDHPGDRFTSEMLVTVPSGYTAISNGTLVSRRPSGNSVTYHYRQTVPHVTYLVSLVVGHFTELTDSWNDVPLSYFVSAAQVPDAQIAFLPTPDMMAFISRLTASDYPFAKYAQTVVADFMWGGMENSSATTLSPDVLGDDRSRLAGSSQDLIVHELAHQWFGDFITPKSWSDYWLSEGFATYFEALYAEETKGPDAYSQTMHELRAGYLSEARESYTRPIVTYAYHDPEDLFDAHLYEKGAWVLHMLRRTLGDPAWQVGLAEYVARHGNDLVETNDLKQVLEEASGRSLTRFFRQWVYSAGHPQISAEWKWDHRNAVVELGIRQTQAADGAVPLFTLPLKVALIWNGGSDTTTLLIGRAEETFYLTAPRAPYRVEIDPQDDILMELSFVQSQSELLGQLAEGGPAARRKAAHRLGTAEAKRVALALGSSLQSDPDPLVRQNAAASLGSMLTRTAREQLYAGLGDAHPAVRVATVRGLSHYRGNRQIADTLQQLFHHDPTYTVPAAIVTAMARLNVVQSYDFIVSALDFSSHREVIRGSAIAALGQMDNPESVDLVLQWAAYGNPPRVRRRAVAILPELARKMPARRRELRLFLINLAQDRDFWVREEVLTSLGKMGGNQEVRVLEQALANEPNHAHREAAWDALQAIISTRQ